MGRDAEVYDLGRIESTFRPGQKRPPVAPTGRVARTRASLGYLAAGEPVARFASDVARSLSVFVPGTSQLARGRFALGFFYLSWLGFLVSLSWAVVGTLDRLAPTLDLLGYSVGLAFWILGVTYVLAATIHLAAVATAFDPTETRSRHPVIPAVASFLLPGWGQVLNGDRVRALMFLSGLWLTCAAWIASSPQATEFVGRFVPTVQPWEQVLRAPFVLWFAKWTIPLLLWCVAVYDAATSAIGRRV